jgi:pyridoxine 4-dehydrogenase
LWTERHARRQEAAGIAYVPFFPLGGFTPLQSTALSDVAGQLGATPMQVALAWLLRRAPNILLIPGTSSVGDLRENLAAAELELPNDAIDAARSISTSRRLRLNTWYNQTAWLMISAGKRWR